MNAYEIEREANIAKNRALIKELGLESQRTEASREPPTKKRKRTPQPLQAPTRSSARLAEAPKPSYATPSPSPPPDAAGRKPPRKSAGRPTANAAAKPLPVPTAPLGMSPDELRAAWTAWTPAAPPPERGPDGVFHFVSHPAFRPNKAPAEILREGAFGGSYFRPLRSARLGMDVADDWRELPAAWLAGLRVERFLTAPEYDPAVNKFGVACGQSIEAWEAAGWIAHRWDVRGWFQWYVRFWLGRRCEDDERQVGRWARCVGERGRWRRALLKKYRAAGVRTVWDDGADDDGAKGPSRQLSPVVHQTCHHWAYEVRQEVLDELWAS